VWEEAEGGGEEEEDYEGDCAWLGGEAMVGCGCLLAKGKRMRMVVVEV
jgi:hypothetical protein